MASRRQFLSLGVLGTAALLPPAWAESGPVLCPVRRATGRPCPGCGLTRSFVHGMHGDLSRSAAAHPAGPALLLLAAVWALAGRRSAGTLADPQSWWATSPRRAALGAVAVAWLSWAALRAVRSSSRS